MKTLKNAWKAYELKNGNNAMPKLFKHQIYALLAIPTLVIAAYIAKFHSYSFSKNPEHWGQLGDYIGGVLNPILSFVTVIILLTTINIQNKQLKASIKELTLTRSELKTTAESAKKQVENLEKEAKLKEHLVLIDKLSSRINRNIIADSLVGGRNLSTFVNNQLSNKDIGYTATVRQSYAMEGTKTKQLISWVVSDLRRLAELIERYETISNAGLNTGKKNSPIPAFYQCEFGEIASVLYINAMLDGDTKSFYSPE